MGPNGSAGALHRAAPTEGLRQTALLCELADSSAVFPNLRRKRWALLVSNTALAPAPPAVPRFHTVRCLCTSPTDLWRPLTQVQYLGRRLEAETPSGGAAPRRGIWSWLALSVRIE